MSATPQTVTIKRGAIEDPERDRIFGLVQAACAGTATGSAIAALADSLAYAVAFATGDRRKADKMLRDLVPDMRASARRNWAEIMAARAQGNVPESNA
jgi:hypothetical protein